MYLLYNGGDRKGYSLYYCGGSEGCIYCIMVEVVGNIYYIMVEGEIFVVTA